MNNQISPTNEVIDQAAQQRAKTLGRVFAKLTLLGLEVRPHQAISVGPIVTAYRFIPYGRTKFSQLESLGHDIAITLGVEDVFIKRLPGESAVAFFVPNPQRTEINFKETVSNVWQAYAATNNPPKVPLNFGVDYLGRPFVEDLASLPHLLIAGSTGAGKSTLLASIITSLVYCCQPTNIQLVMSDTKQVEFQRFVGVPHLLYPPAGMVLETMKQMDYLTEELEDRLLKFNKAKVQNIHSYRNLDHKMPFIVFIIDELADLMQDRTKEEDDNGKRKGPTRGRQCEDKLSYLVQKGRATGIYVIAATQRPSVDVVTGTIKANFPARMALKLPSGADSKTILDTVGAEHLLTPGDMLYISPTRPGITRLHAPYTNNEDIDAAVQMAVQKG